MATRALLLCGDEKAVHAVSQILDELEVSFEHSSEPPFALKRLAVQRFDLLIVDCDNAQNATQVFNSARASSLNKNSIAIAIVEGKAGVPSAFRLGASLVLTKPVSLEQSRNTLRTGIGMARKDEIKPTTTSPVPPSAVTTSGGTIATPSAPIPQAPAGFTSAPVAVAPAGPQVAAPSITASPAVKAPPSAAPITAQPGAPSLPATPTPVAKPAAPAAPAAEKPAVSARPASTPAPPAPGKPSPIMSAESKPTVGVTAFAKAAAASASATATFTTKPDSAPSSSTASNQLKPKLSLEKTSAPSDEHSEAASGAGDTSTSVLRIEDPLAEADDALDPLKDLGVPSFGAIGSPPFAGYEKAPRSRGKGVLIAAVVVLVLAAGGYAAWITQPGLRNLVVSESNNATAKIAALRGQAPPAAVPLKPPPAPVAPAEAQPATSAAAVQPTDASAPNSATPANSPASDETISLGTSLAGAPAAQATNTAATSTTQPKTAPVKNVQPDKTPAHAGSSPALVPASASLPASTAAKPASDLLEVPEDFADDQVIHRVHPLYPKQAKARRLRGTVVLQAVVNKQGKVDSLQLISGDPVLAQAAADAVKQWRYKPYTHDGEPSDFQTRVTVDFKLP
jgi:TonB family protein